MLDWIALLRGFQFKQSLTIIILFSLLQNERERCQTQKLKATLVGAALGFGCVLLYPPTTTVVQQQINSTKWHLRSA